MCLAHIMVVHDRSFCDHFLSQYFRKNILAFLHKASVIFHLPSFLQQKKVVKHVHLPFLTFIIHPDGSKFIIFSHFSSSFFQRLAALSLKLFIRQYFKMVEVTSAKVNNNGRPAETAAKCSRLNSALHCRRNFWYRYEKINVPGEEDRPAQRRTHNAICEGKSRNSRLSV